MVSVGQGPTKPYRYQGRAYRRVGNTTRVMAAEECNRMLFERMHSEQRWENQLADGWSLSDLDENEIRITVEEAIRRGRLKDPGTRDSIELLRGLGLFRNGILLRAAAALFGNEERIQFSMPQCLLRVARFRGVDRTDFLDNRQFHGNVFTLLRVAERFLRDSLPIAGRIEEGRLDRVDEPLFPPLATREALANAFCHRDYSIGGGSVGVAIYDDRLEVTSTGTLHFGLTPEMLFAPHESIPWNPLIADAFYRRGIIERWGRGTLKMAELTAMAGLPQPEIEDARGCVTVRFQAPARIVEIAERSTAGDKAYVPALSHALGLNETQRAILELLDSEGRGLPFREIYARLPLNTTPRQVRRALAVLRDHGLVFSTGVGLAARWRRA